MDHDDAVVYNGGTEEGEREERVREGMSLMRKAMRGRDEGREGREEGGVGVGGGGDLEGNIIGSGIGKVDIKPTFSSGSGGGRGTNKYSRLDNEL